MAKIGTVIDGKYEILKQIGKGGMSTVYLAMDKRLNKQWAVKEISRKGVGKNNEEIVNEVPPDAEMMKKLDHPAIPTIVDIIDDKTSPYIYVVMDYVEGESLDKVLDEYGAQPQDLVIDWAKQICDAFAYLHSQKPPIIYRDMKPANVMLKPEGNIKIIDFGIAREYKEANLADTTVLGTKGYASPEHYGSRQTDARSDIYTIGMTMHHLLTGVDPRPADYIYAPIRQWNPELSGGLERIIDKCVSPDPKDRYQSCNELLYALEHYEEEDGAYKRKQKRKLFSFITSSALALVMIIVGTGGQLLSIYANNQNYDQKINISTSTPYEEKVTSYTEAIELFGNDTRAYLKLLQAYEDNGLFGDNESKQFSNYYNKNKENFSTENTDYLDLAYKAGITYFYLYSGGDNSFRNRVLSSKPFFDTIISSENTGYKNYSIAESYAIVANFYSNFVVNATSVKEPQKEDYENLLSSLETCISNIQEYEGDDAAYIELTMYKAISDLLNDHKKGLATNGIDKNSVLNILDTINTKTQAISVTQEKSMSLRTQILDSYTDYVETINTTYKNTAERSQ